MNDPSKGSQSLVNPIKCLSTLVLSDAGQSLGVEKNGRDAHPSSQNLFFFFLPPCPPAVEVSGLLPVELAVHRAAVFGGPEALEAIVDQLRVLFVEVFMGHHIGGAGVDLVAAHLRKGGEPGQLVRKLQRV